MTTLTFRNANNKSVTFSNRKPFILTTIEGLDVPDITVQTYKGLKQDGVTYIDNTLNERAISLEAVIIANTYNELAELRRRLIEVFNPKLGLGELVFDDGLRQLKIPAIIDAAPILPGGSSNQSDRFQRVLITFYCPTPFWQELTENIVNMALWVGAFQFPLNIPETGIIMGYKEESIIANVVNNGDVPCGIRIEFKALGSVVNPYIVNLNSQDMIKINKTMQAGEIITVTTHFGNKKVTSEMNGVVNNIFQFVDPASVFLQLDIGDNILRYGADAGEESLEVNIFYSPQFLGV